MQTDRKYWLRAKRYGWGWGLPASWQGWATLASFAALLGLDFVVFPPGAHLAMFNVWLGAACALLLTICWIKGEPPRWRWGGD